VEIRAINPVVVDQHERPETAADQLVHHEHADPADADDSHAQIGCGGGQTWTKCALPIQAGMFTLFVTADGLKAFSKAKAFSRSLHPEAARGQTAIRDDDAGEKRLTHATQPGVELGF